MNRAILRQSLAKYLGVKLKITLAAAGLILAIAGFMVWFNLIFYPQYELSSFKGPQYQDVLLKVGEGVAASESLTVVRLLDSQFFSPSPGGDAYAWGTVELHNVQHEKVYVWIGIRWSALQKSWLRRNIDWMADPRDRVFLADGPIENLKLFCLSIDNLWREFERRLKEVWLGTRH
jgi:hypothetical protein